MHALHALGWTSFFAQQVTDDERAAWTPARVVWEGRGQYRISGGDDDWRASLAGRLRHAAASRADLPAVGDWVLAAVRPAEGTATIHRVLARQSCFSRGAAGRSTEVQIVAANIDTVLIVTSCNRDFNQRRIERYLALAWESGARPVVVLNKADLYDGDRDHWYADIAAVVAGCAGGDHERGARRRTRGTARARRIERHDGAPRLVWRRQVNSGQRAHRRQPSRRAADPRQRRPRPAQHHCTSVVLPAAGRRPDRHTRHARAAALGRGRRAGAGIRRRRVARDRVPVPGLLARR